MLAVYVTGPAVSSPAIARAAAALSARGYVVTTATPTGGLDVDDFLAAVDADRAALLAADLLVTLPGSEKLFEVALAETYGVPVVALGDILAPVAA
ncbi:hypothetical protein [Catellatospora methionotrophica]|uniref:hypothetical protein n=1 Tax=Catellatospora methionotrophica TaxID=121620 RepID=UPI0033EE3D4B